MRHGQVTTHCSAGMQVKQCENLCGNTVCSVTNWRGRIPKQRPLQLVWTRLAIGCHVLIFGRECWNSYGRMSWACERVTIFLSQKSRCKESSWAWTFSHGGFCSVQRCWQRICSVWHGCAVGDQTPMCGWMLVQRFCWKHLLDLCSTNALRNEQRLISKTSMCVWWHSKKLLAGVGDIASKWVRGCAKAAGQHSVFREKALPLVACIWPGSVGQRWLAYGVVWCSHPTSATSHAGSIWVWCCVCLRRSRKSAEHPGLWRAASCWPASAAIKTWGSRRTAWQRGGGAGDGQTADLAARWYKARFWNIWTSGIGRFHWMDTAAWRRSTEKVSVLWCLPGSGREMFGGGQRSRYLQAPWSIDGEAGQTVCTLQRECMCELHAQGENCFQWRPLLCMGEGPTSKPRLAASQQAAKPRLAKITVADLAAAAAPYMVPATHWEADAPWRNVPLDQLIVLPEAINEC